MLWSPSLVETPHLSPNDIVIYRLPYIQWLKFSIVC